MDEMCNESEAEELNKAKTNSGEPEISKRSESPVFKCFNTRTSRVSDSSDYDIPSYQFNQSIKSRTSSKCENETNDLILPFSPIFSPIPVNTVQFLPPSIHSLGTVIKNMEKPKTTKMKETEQPSAFQSLGMNDKDISWVSSMESPSPKHIPGCEFNTIEKATFFPEEKFQNIQPRALFSPTSDKDFSCQLISSDSDEDEAYKTNIRLSDVCATLKQLEFKSLETDLKTSSTDFAFSPVIKTKKLDSSKKKRQGILVKSPQENYEFSFGESSLGKAKERSTLIEDDSFQSMSFSCLDELCKTVTEEIETNPVHVPKKFYVTTSNDISKVSSLDGLHSYAKALEESDTAIVSGRKLEKSMADSSIMRLDQSKYLKTDAVKRSHSEMSDVKNEFSEKKIKVTDDGWENLKDCLSESQMNASDAEIFRTVENLEKTLASQESRDLKLSSEVSQEKSNEKENKYNLSSTCQEADFRTADPTCETPNVANGAEISISEQPLGKQILKSCNEEVNGSRSKSIISGKVNQATEKALNQKEKVKSTCRGETPCKELSKIENLEQLKVLTEDLEAGKAVTGDYDESVKGQSFGLAKIDSRQKGKPKEDLLNMSNFQGFFTGSGKFIQVSHEALEKSKALLLERKEDAIPEPNEQNMVCGFSLDPGGHMEIFEENFKKAGSTTDYDKSIHTQSFGCLPQKKEEKNFSGALGKPEAEILTKLNFQGFSTGSGKQIKVGDKALKKAKALMEDCDKNDTFEVLKKEKPEKLGLCGFQGFMSGSGKQIKVSDEALKKAKALMEECCDELSTCEIPIDDVKEIENVEKNRQNFPSFSTGSGKTIQVSAASLDKAKQMMECEIKGDLVSISLGEPAKESFGKTNALEKAEERESSSVSDLSAVELGITRKESRNATEADAGDEIIPSWLHVYNTSPSIASDRLEFTPLVSYESGNDTKQEREYVKSPVLGVGDRFYRKIKKKLTFAKEQTSCSSVGRTVKKTSKLSIDFSVPFKKAKFVEGKAVEEDVKAQRERAREEQERQIKEKDKVKPLKGLLLSRKCLEKRIKWSEAVGDSLPEIHSEESLTRMGVREEVLNVRIENAGDFRFSGEDYFGSKCQQNVEGMASGDGCLVILDDENGFGVEELKKAFLAAPGVQPNLVPSGWVENHYKWIVWKLAHYEKSFPRYFAGRCLTPNNVALQLKYRYDREIDRNERSALKKILERDDTSVKRMVLCVCGIKKVILGETSGYELRLTDGWYSCPARVDAAMSRLIEEEKLFVGTKLMTQGATLVNCDQGASPLEIGENAYLRISTNSTRRVKWDTKLGFQSNPENFPISLGSILPRGGSISRLDVIIVRVYPVLYMEKTSNGHHVTRNKRSEEKAEAEYRRIEERRMERIWNEVKSEMKSAFESSKSERTFSGLGSEGLSQSVGGSSDPVVSRSVIPEDSGFSREFYDRVEKKLKGETLEKRNVSTFLRAKIVDLRKPDYNNPVILTVWNPNEDLMGLLSEGKVMSLMNITVSNSFRVYKGVQVNTTRQTQFRPINRTVKYPTRKLTRLVDVSSMVCPAFEEVDVVGMIALIRDVSYGSRLSQVVYLTDLEFHFVGVVFWGSCKDYGWENVLKVRSIVACSNLLWKKTVNTKEVPSLHATENSIFTENPRHGYLKEEIIRLKETIPKNLNDFLSKCEEELTVKLEESKWGVNRSLDNSKNRLSNGFETKPTASSTPIKSLPMRMKSSEEICAEPSPIQKRVEKLQSYGEPPSLIPLLVRRRKFKTKS